MVKIILQQMKVAFGLLVVFTLLIGVVYTGGITFFAQALFEHEANGSLIVENGKVLGSSLIGQYTTNPKYFWGRPSATQPTPYNAMAAGGSNLGPTNPVLLKTVKERIAFWEASDPGNNAIVPGELVAASASGVDPEISPLAAIYQVHRVAQARHMDEELVMKTLLQCVEQREFGVFGEPRVNVLELNLALDNLSK